DGAAPNGRPAASAGPACAAIEAGGTSFDELYVNSTANRDTSTAALAYTGRRAAPVLAVGKVCGAARSPDAHPIGAPGARMPSGGNDTTGLP
ncbi:hypothetical protein, partial [Brevibacterium sp. HMSC063G07]|uniref:hypothetical protein n=1 Tax=Brevibacterium sp. HMSC063G07 TaxID=1739261 RepID=UPI003525E46A